MDGIGIKQLFQCIRQMACATYICLVYKITIVISFIVHTYQLVITLVLLEEEQKHD